jgi:NTP pyrophosphatase (non-canonical NTP hydrolase)
MPRLDELYKMVAYIYSHQNAQRSATTTFAHFAEVCGMLTIHDNPKRREEYNVVDALCKALGWYFPLLAKLRVRSAEQLVFRKFPYVCPYCRRNPHDDSVCKRVRGTARTVDHQALRLCYENNQHLRPKSLSDWQAMFQKIYPRDIEDRSRSIVGLFEELGELAEAVRVFEQHPFYFAGEAADVFSYLMGIANEISIRMAQDDEHFSLEDEFIKRYPGLCPQCGSEICICPPVPEATVGRMAKELAITTVEEIFNPDPNAFEGEGKRISGVVLERAGGYQGLADRFPFDRGDVNRALILLCLRLGNLLQPHKPEVAERFHSAAIRIGSSAALPGSRKQGVEVTDILDSIRTTWRELSAGDKQGLENGKKDLVAELGGLLGKVRVLFLSCSPAEVAPLRGGTELRVIKEAVKLAHREEDIEIHALTAATTDDLRRALLHGDYEIVHFSGHADGRVLIFEDCDGRSVSTPLIDLAQLIGRHQTIRCVVLNSCESLGNLTVPMAEFTIGMDRLITDDAAVEFARGFYDAVAAGRSIEFAAEEGRSAATLKGLSAPPIKVLKR